MQLLAARWQMAFTLGAHIILAVLGVGMPVLLLVAEFRWLTTGDRAWRTLAHRWSKKFAVLFAVGAVSGTVLSFELGLLCCHGRIRLLLGSYLPGHLSVRLGPTESLAALAMRSARGH
jgi:hypothetical protein